MKFGEAVDWLEKERGKVLDLREMALIRQMSDSGIEPERMLKVLDGETGKPDGRDTSKERTVIYEASGSSGVRRLSE